MEKWDCSVRYLCGNTSNETARTSQHSSGRDFIDALLVLMQEHEVGGALLVSELNHGLEAHRELVEISGLNSDRICAVPQVDPYVENIDDELKTYKAEGIRAIKLSALGSLKEPLEFVTEIQAFRTWEAASKEGLAIFVRPTVWDARLLPYLVKSFPETQVFVESSIVSIAPGKVSYDDLGRPRLNLPLSTMDRFTLWGLSECSNVNIVLSSEYSFSKVEWPYDDLKGWHSVENFLDLFGSERMVWGSDYPITRQKPGYGNCIDLLKTRYPIISEVDHENIMTGLALRKLLKTGKS